MPCLPCYSLLLLQATARNAGPVAMVLGWLTLAFAGLGVAIGFSPAAFFEVATATERETPRVAVS